MTNSIADEEIVAIKKDIIIYAHCNIPQVVKNFSNAVKNFLEMATVAISPISRKKIAQLTF